jgi:Protein of unknown function (DUF5132)
MSKYKVDVNGNADQDGRQSDAEPVQDHDHAHDDHGSGDATNEATNIAAVVGVVVLGAAVVEVALIPGILVGAAAVLAPKYLPKLGDRLQPLFDSTVRGACKLGRKARTVVGEAHERIHDIAAEVSAEEAAATSDSAPTS